jgi:hypothetical protein
MAQLIARRNHLVDQLFLRQEDRVEDLEVALETFHVIPQSDIIPVIEREKRLRHPRGYHLLQGVKDVGNSAIGDSRLECLGRSRVFGCLISSVTVSALYAFT